MYSIMFLVFSANMLMAQIAIDLSGKVTDTGSTAISRAIVTLKNAELSDTTDSQGAFSLDNKVPIGIFNHDQPLLRGLAADIRNNLLTIHVSHTSVVFITIHSLCGQVVSTLRKPLTAGMHALAIPPLAAGIHFCRIKEGHNELTLRALSAGQGRRITTRTEPLSSGLAKRDASFGDSLKVTKEGYNEFSMAVTNPQMTGIAIKLTPVKGTADITTAMGKGFNLGQMFESTQHPRTLAKARAKIDAYYNKGFRNVRIPITWTERVGGDLLVNDANVGDVNRNHPRLAVIEQVVDYALSKSGMYVIINAHHESTLKTKNRSWVLERLWQDIAQIFGDRDYRLIYEILNEPHRSDGSNSPMDPADLRTMTSLAYAKIRAVDPERIIAIGGNQWFGAHEMAQTWPNLDGVGGGRDKNLMATYHHYDPWTFCGDNQGTYDDAWTDTNFTGPMNTMMDWATTVGNGMQIYIGEWGVGWGSVFSQMKCNNIRLYYQKIYHEFASPRGIATCVWDDGGWFKIFDHGSDSFNNNLVDCISGTCDWDGDERFNSACR